MIYTHLKDEVYQAKTNCYKIVATTDTDLNLLLISQDFVKHYVEANGEIEDDKNYEFGKI